ncbi:GNAT family N-acetyltransferase [Crocosphaera sp. UHCC 0190]|uniref:GNAT family N-acetyltransferase n=1 Tax=Crocosphaera sp. UHCC 0190 TaxID=3110246 RepID=UPI002B1F1286|nr:GNAT family N-acetyltransferase [Crocosphaera sp. UHCC 0190]MEA5511210.1 GNAT family N-acetyltransferase [Crocosphaera sp. UHCC 0190]
MKTYYKNYLIRDWQPSDRLLAAKVIETVLQEYGLPWQPEEADQDVIEIEQFYLQVGGEFWIIENQGKIVGTAAYYPIHKQDHAVEIRKMYLLPDVRGKGLGRFLLEQLETVIQQKGFKTIIIETASVLEEAVILYEKSGYEPITEVETKRCDRAYIKKLT